MIPAKFDYVRPGSLDEAVSALAGGGDDAKSEQKKPQVDDKAYKAALERIPEPKEKYDPWGGARPTEELILIEQRADGVDLRVDPRDLRQACLHDLDCRHGPRADPPPELGGVREADLLVGWMM